MGKWRAGLAYDAYGAGVEEAEDKMGSGKKKRTARQQRTVALETERVAGPVRESLFKQILEALQTGGVGAQIPIIGQAQERQQQALSRSIEGTKEDLFRAGLGQSPFGIDILSRQRTAGEQGIARIPTDIAQQFISMAMPGSLGATQSSIGGLGQAAQTILGVDQLALQKTLGLTETSLGGLSGIIQALVASGVIGKK